MNPKNSRKNTPKPVPKKKLKSSSTNVKRNSVSEQNENKSKFYVSGDNKSVVQSSEKKIEEVITTEKSSLTRKLSKIYAKLSGSRESLNVSKQSEDQHVTNGEKPQITSSNPFRFQRSLTLNSIHLSKVYKRPQLEKLSEEKIGEFDKSTTTTTTKSPPLSPSSPDVVLRRRHKSEYRQSLPPGTFDDVDFNSSINSLQPPLPPLQRSSSFISIFRRKISDAKQETINSSWTTSLQNLQQIDYMVSYEDLSFIDYDKFNQYEMKLDEMLNRRNLTTINSSLSFVKKRQRKKSCHDKNLDREKNLYRQSIDSHKLNFLNNINFDEMDWIDNNKDKFTLSAIDTKRISKKYDQEKRNVTQCRYNNNSLRSHERADSSKNKRKFHSWEKISIYESTAGRIEYENVKMVSVKNKFL
jgi:hypothetical protein